MTRLLQITLLATLALATPAQACTTTAAWLADVRAHSIAAKVEIVTDVKGPAAIAAVARMNALPPVTRVVADEIAVIGATSATTGAQFSDVMVGYFVRGCMVARQHDDAEVVAAWLLGEGA